MNISMQVKTYIFASHTHLVCDFCSKQVDNIVRTLSKFERNYVQSAAGLKLSYSETGNITQGTIGRISLN